MFHMPRLSRADLHRVIASGGAALHLLEDFPAAPFGIGSQPGDDLLPPVTDHRPELLDDYTHAERPQQARVVRLHPDAGPHGLPGWAPLYELRPEALLSPSMPPPTIRMRFHTHHVPA
jgi:hypothetical protein